MIRKWYIKVMHVSAQCFWTRKIIILRHHCCQYKNEGNIKKLRHICMEGKKYGAINVVVEDKQYYYFSCLMDANKKALR